MLTFPFLKLTLKINPAAALKQTGRRDKERLAKLPTLWFCSYTSVQAEIGLAHLAGIHAKDQSRIANVKFIKENCGYARFPATKEKSGNVYWQLILPVDNAIDAQQFFASRGIDTATTSLELVSSLQKYPNCEDMLIAKNLYHNGLFIPCYPALTGEDMERIALEVRNYFQRDVKTDKHIQRLHALISSTDRKK